VADAWIVDVVRTPRSKGRADGALHDVHPQELLAQCLRALAARVGFEPSDVDDVIAGNGILTGDHDAVGRLATLLAGWPQTVPGMTLNRFCGSAQQAITVAAMGVASGLQDLVVAGGVESMSRWDLTAGSVTIDGGNPDFRARFPTVPQGISADLIASLEGFSRTDVDAFAVESQRRAEVAVDEGRFDRGIVAITGADGEVLLARDEHPRPGTTLEGLAKLRPAFAEAGATYDAMALEVYPEVDHIDHVHHAGNSSGVVDGAAAAVVASDAWVAANGVTPRAPLPSRHSVQVLGTGDLLTQLARCCNPVPGDSIIGYITRSRGVTIHRADCFNVLHEDEKDRLVDVEWGRTGELYPVAVHIDAWDRVGLLRDLSTVVSEEKVNMVGVRTEHEEERITSVYLTLETTGISQLSRLMAKLETVKGVITVNRQVDGQRRSAGSL